MLIIKEFYLLIKLRNLSCTNAFKYLTYLWYVPIYRGKEEVDTV